MDQPSVDIGNGRRLGYREFGDPAGRPIVNCHGGLVSGLDIAAFHDAARAIGVRIISPDRPGLGSSSPAPGRTTADWAGDVAALLDVLAVERAAVLGWSMGGQYALACAAVIPDRVSRTVVIAGALPLDDAGTFGELNAMDRRLTALSENHPHIARTSFAALGRFARHARRAWTRVMARDATPEEAAALHALPDPGLASAAAAALGCPAGMVEEYLAWVRPWGFEPEAITRPVHIRQGDADSLVPPHWGQELARRIPGAEIDLLPGEGHFLGFRHQADILGDLVSD
jgi:pimeloyl-ACP methyl ester carboxylesterase